MARAHDGRVTVRVGERVAEDQLGTVHAGGQDVIEFRSRPAVVQRRSLDLGIGAALSDAAPDDDARPRSCGFRNPIVMFGGQAGIGDLERIEHAEVDQAGKLRQGTGNADEPNNALIAIAHQQLDQSFTLQCIGIASVELQDIQEIGLQPLEAGLDIPLEDVLVPHVANLQVILVLDVSTPALGGQVELASTRADVPADSLLADTVVGRGVNEIDAGVEHRVEAAIGVFLTDDAYPPGVRAAEAHAAVAEWGDFETCAAKFLFDHGLAIWGLPSVGLRWVKPFFSVALPGFGEFRRGVATLMKTRQKSRNGPRGSAASASAA